MRETSVPWSFRRSRPDDTGQMYAVWYASVLATHGFLAPADLREICEIVRLDYLPHNKALVAVDGTDRVIGFMEHAEGEIAGLFIAPEHYAKGLGRAFIDHAAAIWGSIRVKVNTQNSQAVGFYQAVRFETYAASPTDEEGRSYPLLLMGRPADESARP